MKAPSNMAGSQDAALRTHCAGGRAAVRSPRSAIVAGMLTLTFAAPSTATCKQAPVNATLMRMVG